jgi:serine/threonine-protein kinase
MSDGTIGQYRIESKLGEGGVGEVHLAVDTLLGRTVAIKRLRPELAARPQIIDRFRAEAQTLATLNHPNVATLYGLEWDGELPVMVMEYVDGVSLAALVSRLGPLTLGQAMSIFDQALEGIAYIHSRGVVHRDIKGSNLLLDSDGVLKIMDFGISRVLGTERLTRVGQLVGTPEFMSPEQIRGDEPDARSDLYSLGILLWLLLSGRLPFVARGEYDVLRAQVEEDPEPFSRVASGLPAEIGDLLARALAKEPADRFQSAEEFRAALAPFLAEKTAPAELDPEHPTGSELRELVAATRDSEAVRGELDPDQSTRTADRLCAPVDIEPTQSVHGVDGADDHPSETTPWLTAVPLGEQEGPGPENREASDAPWGWRTAVGMIATLLAFGFAANHLWLESRVETAAAAISDSAQRPSGPAGSPMGPPREAPGMRGMEAAETPDLALESGSHAEGAAEAVTASNGVTSRALPSKSANRVESSGSAKQGQSQKAAPPAKSVRKGDGRSASGNRTSAGGTRGGRTERSAKSGSKPGSRSASKSTSKGEAAKPEASDGDQPKWMIRRD